MAFFSLFFAFSRSDYLELSFKTFRKHVGTSRPALVKFYSLHCGDCQSQFPGFITASTLYTDVLFAGVDCPKEDDVCEYFQVKDYPATHFFHPGNFTPIPYKGNHSVSEYITYIENITGIQPNPTAPPHIVKITAKSHQKLINDTTCGLLTYITEQCPECPLLLPQLKQLSSAFLADPNITIATVKCKTYPELCPSAVDTLDEPVPDQGLVMNLLFRGQTKKYQGTLQISSMVEAVNRKCGVNRQTNGLLKDSVGTVPEADEIVEDFVTALHKHLLVEKMRAISGAEFYIKTMERFLEKGMDGIKADIAMMAATLKQRKGSEAVLDNIKRRYNVAMKFLPKQIEDDVYANL
jgi:thiol-disulfide isomerase/thioredoxin